MGWAEIFEGTFPPGSVSGAPKSSALQAIADLEPSPRGPYCGAVGWVDADRGRAELAVGIRTFWAEHDSAGSRWLRFGTGAGITWGSDAAGRVGGDTVEGGSPHRSGVWKGSGMSDDVRVWVNGALVGPRQPAIAALDHGVTVGDGAFETCKVTHGQVFAATRHARRLDRTLAGLGLPPADHDQIAAGIKAVLSEGDPIDFGRLRYSVTGGPGPLGSDRHDSPLTYIVTAGSQPRPPASAALAVVPWVRNERSAVAGLKTTSYAENVVALAYAKERGAIEAVFGNTRDELCEGTGSNIFVVRRRGGPHAAPVSGCLAGVTRAVTHRVVPGGRHGGARGDPPARRSWTTATRSSSPAPRRTSSPLTALTTATLVPGPVTARAAEVFARYAATRMDP